MAANQKKPRFPQWLRRPIAHGAGIEATRKILGELGLATVCHGAKCPNIGECFSRHTATFMILGRVCTRNCRFCNISEGRPEPVAEDEAGRVAKAAARMNLRHVVITSVTRDDLPDGGAGVFARCIELLHNDGRTVEVLTPDFRGSMKAIRTVAKAGPEVYNHNVETVPRLYRDVRPGADYERSLELLRLVKDEFQHIATKSGMMVGCGETPDEVLSVMDDLRCAACDVITIGQYLAPSEKHLPVARFAPPGEFNELEKAARRKGFLAAACGPYIRSSYNAADILSKLESSKVGKFEG
ncbi:MAG: lipoyl synthase [Planctomycetota bacterium]|nr:MAG: lipoyl synthase [Planctomycetota bacterium]